MPDPHPTDRDVFVATQTGIEAPPLVPELRLHLASEMVPIWQASEEELAAHGLPPPFWAFAWAGGQALARFLLDGHWPLAGKRVLDLGAGSGLVALAAAKAGAASVVAADIDLFAQAAMARNARLNGLELEIAEGDLLAREEDFDLILVGDLFYERPTAHRVLAWLDRRLEAGAEVLVGDPGRYYLPTARLAALAEYRVETTKELEDNTLRLTKVWRLTPLTDAAPPSAGRSP